MSTDTPNRLGKGMIVVACLLCLGLLTVFFNHILEKKHNPNTRVQSTHALDGGIEVVLTRNSIGHYVAQGFINQQAVTFFLDTGATQVSIPLHIANKLGLERGLPMQVGTANGTITVYSTRLAIVALGDIVLRDISASINPQDTGDDILLGMSFLRQIEFTQRGNQLILRQHP
ncbi:clan AA aspartic protease, TIGR02281 family [Beggiatoa alba B18LD]|uniref:Clan AA aspartic protease, TIGR02281 family n=1 Tax=Beggiatoa alba B18LD TaxID=395493 RepID=I3CGT2_9GAMM|nr:TIGR02281 family clan AA aspartic protease [Beggiatoa alba]EIJ42825.1 clan AA aspartic protease, TIGR02281 family [Beggiatoa alba B18LD]